MLLATVSAIDGYGFSFNYVGRGNTTDNAYQSLYDFLLSILWYVIYIYIYIHIHGYTYINTMMT